jgi:hypothetical protein
VLRRPDASRRELLQLLLEEVDENSVTFGWYFTVNGGVWHRLIGIGRMSWLHRERDESNGTPIRQAF